ncbi:soluble quinoprotein glucose dehydrogenase [Neurospora tetrasperma FGSC 2509]|nr:soluble quinoprotein glucose dehydrogenase [Neurospora tetrasperma FGSC 2509]
MLPSLSFWLSSTSVQAAASTCQAPVPASYPAPVVRNGFEARLVATGLKKPRGVIVDSKGRLLVVEAGKGITHLVIKDDGWPCLSVEKTTTIVSMSDLNHGIQLSIDGKTLYASSSNSVYSWAYDADAIRVSDEKSPKTLISNMTNAGGGHSTRTLLISRKQPGILLVSRGSGSNIDNGATDHSSGISQIRAFDISDPNLGTPGGGGKVYDYPSEGWTIGWGLRNSVGVAEEPNTGGIYSVENSADGIKRFGVDIHEDSPGEEMNYHGVLRFPSNRSSSSGQGQQQGGNHGYPYCLALYNSSATPSFPSLGNLKTGSQFTHDSTPYSIPFLPSSDSSSSQVKPINITTSDTSCSSTNFIPPRLTFPAHTAPLDIKFSNGNGNQSLGLAYISFHGSWDRSTPAGYKLSAVRFDTSKGEPIEASDSTNSLVDIMWNRDVSKCPEQCFRPVGLAVDEQERIWMTDDDKGDVWVLKQVGEVKDEEGADGGSGSGNVNGDSDSAAAPMRAKRSGSCAEWLGVGMSAMAAVAGSLLFVVL